ncbi:hypothetical protein Efla_000354 [Eimeria flavescens]
MNQGAPLQVGAGPPLMQEPPQYAQMAYAPPYGDILPYDEVPPRGRGRKVLYSLVGAILAVLAAASLFDLPLGEKEEKPAEEPPEEEGEEEKKAPKDIKGRFQDALQDLRDWATSRTPARTLRANIGRLQKNFEFRTQFPFLHRKAKDQASEDGSEGSEDTRASSLFYLCGTFGDALCAGTRVARGRVFSCLAASGKKLSQCRDVDRPETPLSSPQPHVGYGYFWLKSTQYGLERLENAATNVKWNPNAEYPQAESGGAGCQFSLLSKCVDLLRLVESVALVAAPCFVVNPSLVTLWCSQGEAVCGHNVRHAGNGYASNSNSSRATARGEAVCGHNARRAGNGYASNSNSSRATARGNGYASNSNSSRATARGTGYARTPSSVCASVTGNGYASNPTSSCATATGEAVCGHNVRRAGNGYASNSNSSRATARGTGYARTPSSVCASVTGNGYASNPTSSCATATGEAVCGHNVRRAGNGYASNSNSSRATARGEAVCGHNVRRAGTG